MHKIGGPIQRIHNPPRRHPTGTTPLLPKNRHARRQARQHRPDRFLTGQIDAGDQINRPLLLNRAATRQRSRKARRTNAVPNGRLDDDPSSPRSRYGNLNTHWQTTRSPFTPQ